MKKELKNLYSGRAGRIDEVDAPRLDYLMIDGTGDPNEAFGAAFEALYSVAYPLKFAIKARDARLDYVVMPPEATYHGTSAEAFAATPRSKWRWTVMLLQPVKPTAAELRAAKQKATEKSARAQDVRLASLHEGACLQTLHVGPYATEGATMARMQEHADAHGLRWNGAHHEIYLSDPRKGDPAKTKTLLRMPVAGKRVAAMAA